MEVVKQFWKGVDKKIVLRFSVIAGILWVGLVAFFWTFFNYSEDKLIESKADVLKEIKTNSFETPQKSNPEFIDPYNSSPPPAEDLYAHRELMEIYYKEGRVDRSSIHQSRIEKFFIRDSAFLRQSAEITHNLGEYAKSLELLEKALEFRPTDHQLLSLKMLSQYRLGQVNETLKEARELVEKYPDSPELHTALGTMEFESEQSLIRPDYHLLQALQLQPGYIPAMYQMGRKFLLEGNYQDALSFFQNILEQDPTQTKARGQLAITYYYLGKDVEAEKTYQTTLALNPQDYNTWYNYGEFNLAKSYSLEKVQEKRVRMHQALDCYLNAIKHNPTHPDANFKLGVLLNWNKQNKEAITHLENTLRARPDDVRALIQLSVAYENLSMNTEALDILKRAFRLNPNNKAVIEKIKQLS